MQDYFSNILYALAKKGVRFVVGGGVAGVLHGIERVTMDIDVALDWEEGNARGFVNAMKELNMVPRAPVPPEFIISVENRNIIVNEKNAIVFTFNDPKDPLKHVDIFLTEDHSYAEFVKSSIEVPLRDLFVRVLSKQKLLEVKQRINPPRPKDIFDIAELKRLIQKDKNEQEERKG